MRIVDHQLVVILGQPLVDGRLGHACWPAKLWQTGLAPDRRQGQDGNPFGRPPAADDSAAYPARMLAFIQKKFVGSYLALRAVSRVHWPSVYAWRTRSAASSLVKFT
jgi:hypothetical protein